MAPETKQWLMDHPEVEEQVREGLYQHFIAAKVVDKWNRVPLVTSQELEKAIVHIEKRYI